MEIEVLNCKDARLKDYVIRAIEFYGKKLITNKRIFNSICIEVEFTGDIKDMGSASVDGYNSAKKPREFLIEINKNISGKSVMQVLAHEMVHVKQFAYGETNEDLTLWCGEYVDSDKLDYYDHPWEIEAYGKEQGLLSGFVVQERLWEVLKGIHEPDSEIKKQSVGWKTK